MCCIFKYFSWTVDLIQRIWTFLMSCCIAGAICCLFIVASLAGIALGYNYSIVEFVSLKSSKVSVIVQRDVSNEKPQQSLNQQHGSLEDHRKSYRPLKEKNNKYDDEPSFLSLLTKSFETDPVIDFVTHDKNLDDIIASYPNGSVEQMKAVLNHIYLKKMKKYWLTSTDKTSTSKVGINDTGGGNLVLFSEYDEKELKNWHRVAQNNSQVRTLSVKSNPETWSEIEEKEPHKLINVKPSLGEIGARKHKIVTNVVRSKPTRRRIYTITRTTVTIISNATRNSTKMYQTTKNLTDDKFKEDKQTVTINV